MVALLPCQSSGPSKPSESEPAVERWDGRVRSEKPDPPIGDHIKHGAELRRLPQVPGGVSVDGI